MTDTNNTNQTVAEATAYQWDMLATYLRTMCDPEATLDERTEADYSLRVADEMLHDAQATSDCDEACALRKLAGCKE